MNKNYFLLLLASVALAGFGTQAFAEYDVRALAAVADLTIDASVEVRSRLFNELDVDKDAEGGRQVDTQERVRLGLGMKAGIVKGRIQIENDWDSWGRLEKPQGNGQTAPGYSGATAANGHLAVREAWLQFNLPGTAAGVKAGHQFLQLGQGWFFRSMKYGSDAWVVYTDLDPVHLGFVNVKISEGAAAPSDDTDAYVLVAAWKARDAMSVGLDLTLANDRYNSLGLGAPPAQTQLRNLGLNMTGKAGRVDWKAELDIQTGTAKDRVLSAGTTTADAKLKGNQIVVQGSVPMEPATINFTVARGSGPKAGDKDYDQVITFLDADPHYTFLYEYKVAGPCGFNTGFCNTTAFNVGASYAVTRTLTVGADLWMLQATEKVPDATTAGGGATKGLGNEIDVKVGWKLADNLVWNWTWGYLDPGKGLGKDPATGVQGILSARF